LLGKDDFSRHEKTLANLLHEEIFETGRYFKETRDGTPSFRRQNRKEDECLLDEEVYFKRTVTRYWVAQWCAKLSCQNGFLSRNQYTIF
jgi:hypothetical protein